jgi:hypothetical protein
VKATIKWMGMKVRVCRCWIVSRAATQQAAAAAAASSSPFKLAAIPTFKLAKTFVGSQLPALFGL